MKTSLMVAALLLNAALLAFIAVQLNDISDDTRFIGQDTEAISRAAAYIQEHIDRSR